MIAPLDSRQLRAFRILARTGSFTQTARELHLTQSGISHSMKALESEIMRGVTKRVIKLNTAARKLSRLSAQIRKISAK